MVATRSAGIGNPQRFRSLIPLDSLSDQGFERVLNDVTLRGVKAGKLLFRRGKRDEYSLYLLEGRITLSGPRDSQEVQAGSDRARYPLVDLKPHEFEGTALTDCIVAVIETAQLEKYLTWDQMARKAMEGYEVREFEGTTNVNWMLQMLQTKAFMRLPTANIQSLFSRFEEFPVNEDQVVVEEGDPGDYYYVITEGRCRVTRRSGSGGVTLAELGPRDTFGEEALLTDKPRNATVTMLTKGTLMRLAREDFDALMSDPLVNLVDKQQAAEMMRQGAVPLDVRLENEFRRGSVKGALNLPLYLLRLKAATLDRSRRYIVLCDTGARSAAAAFLLGERGLDAWVLEGGLASLVHDEGRNGGG
jgi:CRP-like cAMP-binding protein